MMYLDLCQPLKLFSVDDYDAATQKAIVSDPLMETSETFVIDTSKATNVAIFKSNSC